MSDFAAVGIIVGLKIGESLETISFEDLKRRRVVLVLDPSQRNPLLKFPGGRSDFDESPMETVKREVTEETGLTLDQTAIPGGERFRYWVDHRSHRQYFFLGATAEGCLDERLSGDENGESVFVDTAWTIGDIIEGCVEILPRHEEALQALLRTCFDSPVAETHH